ncbi:MAG TPA: hypothetical protein VK679_19385 [Gemmatimonadaceae bacterium]|jgi:hypothetical protein|nr:hypothetical protein [Gemmatimonadaceae bacterium]
MTGFARLLVGVLVIGVLAWYIRSASSAARLVARPDSVWTRTLALRDMQPAANRSQRTTSAGNVVRTPVARQVIAERVAPERVAPERVAPERAVAERVAAAPPADQELLRAKIDSALADARVAARDGEYTTARYTLGWVGRTLDSASGSNANAVITTLRAQRDSTLQIIRERCKTTVAPRNANGSPARPPCP